MGERIGVEGWGLKVWRRPLMTHAHIAAAVMVVVRVIAVAAMEGAV